MTQASRPKPKRVRMTRKERWRDKHPDAVIVARRTKWGNPWRVVPVRDNHFPWGEAADVIHEETGSSIGRFAQFTRSPGTGAPYWACQAYRRDLSEELIAAARTELVGKDLACWCRLDQPCHADILLAIAAGRSPMPEQATSWRMHAHDHDGTFFHIGDRRYVELHGGRDPIVEVDVALVDHADPAATHWGWLKTGETEPSNVWPSRAQLDICFHYGPAAEERAGHGRVVRLAVHPTGAGDRQ